MTIDKEKISSEIYDLTITYINACKDRLKYLAAGDISDRHEVLQLVDKILRNLIVELLPQKHREPIVKIVMQNLRNNGKL